MAVKPIIFSGPMVRALLGWRKTQTRRAITRHNVEVLGERWGTRAPWCGLRFDEAWVREASPISAARDVHLAVPFCHPNDEPELTEDCGIYRVTPIIAPGDMLWVREAWRCNGWATDLATIFYRASEGDGYTAMCEQYPVAGKNPMRVTGTWRAAIHMPRWASRLTLRVTDVRVQRVQDISEEDAIAEGCRLGVGIADPSNAVFEYQCIWNSLNEKRGFGWDENPWVVALSFDVLRQNVDTLPGAGG